MYALLQFHAFRSLHMLSYPLLRSFNNTQTDNLGAAPLQSLSDHFCCCHFRLKMLGIVLHMRG